MNLMFDTSHHFGWVGGTLSMWNCHARLVKATRIRLMVSDLICISFIEKVRVSCCLGVVSFENYFGKSWTNLVESNLKELALNLLGARFSQNHSIHKAQETRPQHTLEIRKISNPLA